MLHSHNHDTYAETKSPIMTSLEKYPSHTLVEMVAKGLRKGCVRGELETEQTATY